MILLGILMILSAGVLCAHNIQENRDAEQYAVSALSTLKERIPEAPADSSPDSLTISTISGSALSIACSRVRRK